MTTNVPKGANRASAMAKKNKHAQRTPLPPRREVIAETRAVIEEATAPSVAKATAFVAAAGALGWETVLWWDGDHSKVLSKRGEESIQIEWLGGVFVPDTCTYHRTGRNAIRLRNASAAKQRMAVSEKAAAEEAERVTRFRTERTERTAKAPARTHRALPVGWETALDADVIELVRGKKITWVNRVSGLEEQDFVRDVQEIRVKATFSTTTTESAKIALPSLAAPKIHEGTSGRTIHFLGAFGFRCVLVSQIVRIGR